jgi:ABC-2 type transport system ATP-binding protein
LVVRGATTTTVTQKLSALSSAKRVAVSDEKGSRLTVTVFPKPNQDGELTRAVLDVSQGWAVEELRTESGRLDEVFRSITLPDTMKEVAK